MTTMLDILSLRRPEFLYVSPAVCEAIFSGTSHPVIVLEPFGPQPGPTGLVRGGVGKVFLTWRNYPGAVCFSFYVASEPDNPNSPYNLISECMPANSVGVCTNAFFKISAVTTSGETPLSDPIFSPGDGYTNIPLPQFPHTLCYNLYINLNTLDANDVYTPYWSCLPVDSGGGFEVCSPGCYKVGVITPDGQSDLSDPFCIGPDDLGTNQGFWNTEQTAECPEGETGDPVTTPANQFFTSVFFPPGTTTEQRDALAADAQNLVNMQALEAAAAQLDCHPPACSVDWDQIVWEAPTLHHGTASFLGENFSVDLAASIPPLDPQPDDAGSVLCNGSMLFTGCASTQHLTLTVDNAFSTDFNGAHVTVAVRVDGNFVGGGTVGVNPPNGGVGVFVFPLVIPDSVNALITVRVTGLAAIWDGSFENVGNISVNGTLGP